MSEHGYRNFLTADAIVAEARALADADGLDAVSMRTLATRLGCTPRALYRHVSGKEEVLELLADAAFGTLPTPTGPWDRALHEFFTAMRALLVGSPAVARIVAQQAVAGPHFRRHADALVTLLLEAGFTPEPAAEAVVTLAQFTLGAALPGTGQRLHDSYRDRLETITREAGPALRQVAHHLVTDRADARFATALTRLISAYHP